MKFIHTADWHLGASLHGSSLLEDQAHVLDQLVEIIREIRPDFVIVAGDIYDKLVPKPEAVDLLDDTIKKITLGLKVPLIAIAGNHDSKERLNFCADLTKNQGFHVFAKVDPELKPLVFYDNHGPVNIAPLTYADPAVIRYIYQCEKCQDHNEAMKIVVDRMRRSLPKGERSIVCAHAFVAGSDASDSESPLSVGGTEAVDALHFDEFTYTALGHLHRPQRAKGDNIRYSGSILKYSFSEESHIKGVDFVEIGERQASFLEHISLVPKRDLRIVRGSFEELMANIPDSDNYVMAILEDEEPILDLMPRLRKVYKGLLHIERLQMRRSTDVCITVEDYKSQSIVELFTSFYEQVAEEKLNEKQIDMFKEAHESFGGGELP